MHMNPDEPLILFWEKILSNINEVNVEIYSNDIKYNINKVVYLSK